MQGQESSDAAKKIQAEAVLYGDPAEAAISVVASQLIADLVAAHAGRERETYPEIGEYDWVRVVTRARELTWSPPPALLKLAYSTLTHRRRAAAPGAVVQPPRSTPDTPGPPGPHPGAS